METIQFEGIKTALKQTKDGYSLTLALHPDDIPDDLVRDFVGARYMVVMVRLGDNEAPIQREVKVDKAVMTAGMVCRDPKFWNFIGVSYQDEIYNEKQCTEWLKIQLDIDSRSDLKTNEQAKNQFAKIYKEFKTWEKS